MSRRRVTLVAGPAILSARRCVALDSRHVGAFSPSRHRRSATARMRTGSLAGQRVGIGVLAVLLTALLRPVPALAQTPPVSVVEYYHLDALGSVRVVTDDIGQVITRHDFLPFGEE